MIHRRPQNPKRSGPCKIPRERWPHLDWSQTNTVLAARLGMTAAHVGWHRRELGLWKSTLERRRERFAKLPRGLSAKEVARRLRVSRNTAYRWFAILDYPGNTFRTAREILRAKFKRLPPGLTYKQIAQRFHMSKIMARKRVLQFGYPVRLERGSRRPGPGPRRR